MLRFNTSKLGDEQNSFEEYVDRVKQGQNDIAMVSSSSFLENLRKQGYEVPYMADPVDEYAVHQFKESDGTKLNPITKEGLDPGGQDEKKAFEELVKETPGDKVEEVIVNDRWVDFLRAHTMSEHGLPVDMERIMNAQVSLDSGSQQQLQATQQKERKEGRKRVRRLREKSGRQLL